MLVARCVCFDADQARAKPAAPEGFGLKSATTALCELDLPIRQALRSDALSQRILGLERDPREVMQRLPKEFLARANA